MGSSLWADWPLVTTANCTSRHQRCRSSRERPGTCACAAHLQSSSAMRLQLGTGRLALVRHLPVLQLAGAGCLQSLPRRVLSGCPGFSLPRCTPGGSSLLLEHASKSGKLSKVLLSTSSAIATCRRSGSMPASLSTSWSAHCTSSTTKCRLPSRCSMSSLAAIGAISMRSKLALGPLSRQVSSLRGTDREPGHLQRCLNREIAAAYSRSASVTHQDPSLRSVSRAKV